MSATTLDEWATEKISVFLGLDLETLQTQILPYLNTLRTPDDVAEYLQEMLGTEDTTNFIQEYISRRFVSPPVAKQSNSAKNKRASAPVQSVQPSQQSTTTQAWANEKNVYRKKDKEEEYFVGKKNKSTIGSKSTSADPSSVESPVTSVTSSPLPVSLTPSSLTRVGTAGSSLLSDKLDKKKKKQIDDSMDLEKALRELEISASAEGGKRRACQCQATKHPLLTIAPNCLSCGKIICTLEGPGPCTFCGSPVLSRDQQLALISEAKRRRAEEAQTRQQAATRKARAPGMGRGTVAYAAKLGGNVIPRRVEEEWEEQVREEEEKLRQAEEHKERLLEYDRTSAKRSRVIDQATEFTLPTDRPNQWLSPQERALAIKTQQANLRRLESTQTRKVMTIDPVRRRVIVENAPILVDEENAPVVIDDENGQVPERERSRGVMRGSDGVSAGTYARNPLLGGMAPRFVRGATRYAKTEEGKGKGKGKDTKENEEKKGKESKEKSEKVKDNKPKEKGEASGFAKPNMETAKPVVPRLQHEVEVGFAERMLIGGEDGERETIGESGCG